MKTINKILKIFGLALMRRETAIEYTLNNYVLLLLKQFINKNPALYKNSVLGEIINSIE